MIIIIIVFSFESGHKVCALLLVEEAVLYVSGRPHKCSRENARVCVQPAELFICFSVHLLKFASLTHLSKL